MVWLVFYFDAGALFNEGVDFQVDNQAIDFQGKTGLSNISRASYWVYSWGFGFRIQVPMLPLRLYMGQRLKWDNTLNWFTKYDEHPNLEVVVGIGDTRF